MMVARLYTTKIIEAMVEALRDQGFPVVYTEETAIATFHTRAGEQEIFRALKKGDEDAWITRHESDLFT